MDAGCSSPVRDLLHEAAGLLATDRPDWCELFRAALEQRIDAAAPNRRRRHIHCHGAIASDRRLLLLREVLRSCTPERGFQGWAAIAYAMSDYDWDHFVMLGPNCAGRVGRLASWVGRSLATPGTISPRLTARSDLLS